MSDRCPICRWPWDSLREDPCKPGDCAREMVSRRQLLACQAALEEREKVGERLREACHQLALHSAPTTDATIALGWGIEHNRRKKALEHALNEWCRAFDAASERSRAETPKARDNSGSRPDGGVLSSDQEPSKP